MYRYLVHSILLVVCAFWWNGEARGQYFGRNKPQYHSFDFEVLQTPHFEIYHYTNDSTIGYMAELSERWYSIYQKVFSDTIQFKNPIIFYNNHADFQQTTAVNSLIGTGTGGVTEALKNRIVMPIMGTWAQTDHVIGHELVHAFQYNMLREADSLSLQNIQYLPLWMVEGMAEYLSIGRVDSHTAMWMRDAVFYDDIPSIKDLNSDPKYFPYRYGHSFWAFIGSNWGDSTVIKLFKNTASYGLKVAVDSVLGINTKELSNMWKTALIDHYKPWFKDSVEIIKGKKLLDKKNAGSMNLSPVLSSDGNYLVFYSERDVFTIDLYLADARSGHIIRKLNSYSKIDHIDALNFIESSGTWSPDNRFFAYVVFSKGQNTIVVLNVGKNEIIKEIDIPGVPSISNPVWSPVEDQLVFTGLVNGQNDLFLYDMESKKVQQLTDDWYSDIQPAWSPDGEKLAFVTDRLGWQNEQKGRFNLAVLKLSDRSVENIEVFTKADNLNPIFKDSENILFLSNRDGFRNLYSYNLNTGKVFQHTDYYIGISGITSLSPAISYSSQSGQLAYSYYQKNGYNIYSAPIDSLPGKSVLKDSVNFTAATLPEFTANKSLIIQPYIDTLHVHRPLNRDSVKKLPYKPKFKLDYIGGASMGVSVSRYGTGLMGGVNTMFSDILGTNQLFAAIALNGEIYDFGSQFAYFNQKKRTSWGVVLSHIPYKTGWLGHSRDSLALKDTTIVVDNFTIDILRTFENQVSLLTFFPFSQTRRVEVSGSMAHYGFRLERFNNYYYEGFKIDENKKRLPSPKGYNLWNSGFAYVSDNSYFGMTSPMKGHRFRFEIVKFGGEFSFYNLLADYRKYVFIKPISLAGRIYNFSRFGLDVDRGNIPPVFLGYPTLIRGYDNVMLGINYSMGSGLLTPNDLFGNKILVANFELRIPFTGPQKLAIIQSNHFYSDVNLFLDAGTILNPIEFENVENNKEPSGKIGRVIVSTGVSMRINLMGQVIIEPFYAVPWQRNDVSFGVWGINFIPGW